MPNITSAHFEAHKSHQASALRMRPVRTAARGLLGCLFAGVSFCALPVAQAATAEPSPVESALTASAWSWGSQAEIRFGADGRGSTSDGVPFRWEIIRPQIVRLTELTSPTGSRTDHEALIVLNDNDDQFAGTNFTGIETTGIRKTPPVGEAADQTINASAPDLSPGDATNALLAHSWSWAADGATGDPNLEFQFLPTGIFLSSTGLEWNWRLVGPHRVMIQGVAGQVAYLEFDNRFKGFTTTGFNGSHKISGAQRSVIVPGAHIAVATGAKSPSAVPIPPRAVAALKPIPPVKTAALAPKLAPHPAPRAQGRPAPAVHAMHRSAAPIRGRGMVMR